MFVRPMNQLVVIVYLANTIDEQTWVDSQGV